MNTPPRYSVEFTEAEWEAIKRCLIGRDAPWHDAAAEHIQATIATVKRAEREAW